MVSTLVSHSAMFDVPRLIGAPLVEKAGVGKDLANRQRLPRMKTVLLAVVLYDLRQVVLHRQS